MTRGGVELSEILEREVFINGANLRFGELSFDDASAHADALRAGTGWGPTVRVAPVAHAWRELANAIRSSGAACARELDPQTLLELAPRLWLVLPGEN